jgi:hypothetical protein
VGDFDADGSIDFAAHLRNAGEKANCVAVYLSSCR